MNSCSDNCFDVIDRAKQDLLKTTNIDTSPKEMEVLDNFLFRCWQMGWLKQYEETYQELNPYPTWILNG